GAALPDRVGRRVRSEPPAADRSRPRGARQDRLPGDCDRPRDAVELPRQQTLVVPETALSRVVRVLLPFVGALALAPAAAAGTTTPSTPVYDSNGHIVQAPLAPTPT